MTKKQVKKIRVMVTLLTLLSKPLFAVSYNANNADMLLVFRKANSKDLIYSIGSVNNYLSVAPGSTVTVTGYSTNQVYTNFNSSFSGVLFNVSAYDPNQYLVWITDADQAIVPDTLTLNGYTTLSSKIDAVGNNASTYTANNPSTAYVVAASGSSSYSYTVSEGTSDIATWNGNLPFIAEAAANTPLKFYELKANGPGQGTPPGKLVGTFTMASNGVITFTAPGGGAVLSAARIVSVARTGNANQISFTTTNGNNYRLLHSSNLQTWTTNSAVGTVAGDNTVKIFTDNTTDSQRYYRIQSY